MAAVREIYAHYVLHSLATFEETPPTLEEMFSAGVSASMLGFLTSSPRARKASGVTPMPACTTPAPHIVIRSRIRSMSRTDLAARA